MLVDSRPKRLRAKPARWLWHPPSRRERNAFMRRRWKGRRLLAFGKVKRHT